MNFACVKSCSAPNVELSLNGFKAVLCKMFFGDTIDIHASIFPDIFINVFRNRSTVMRNIEVLPMAFFFLQ